jgi:hypothetical protein
MFASPDSRDHINRSPPLLSDRYAAVRTGRGCRSAAGASVAAPVLGLLKRPGISKVLYRSFTVIMGERLMSVLPDLR